MFGLWMFGPDPGKCVGFSALPACFTSFAVSAPLRHMAVDYFQYQHVVQQIRFLKNAGMTDAVNLLLRPGKLCGWRFGAVMG